MSSSYYDRRSLNYGAKVRMLPCWVHTKDLQQRTVVGQQLKVEGSFDLLA